MHGARKRFSVIVGVTVLVVGLAVFGSAAAQGAGATLTVTPNTGLSNAQQVTVAGDGFNPGDGIVVQECKPGTPPACKNIGGAIANGSGGFTVSAPVTTDVGSGCLPANDCYIEAHDISGTTTHSAQKPIRFGAGGTTTTTGQSADPCANPTIKGTAAGETLNGTPNRDVIAGVGGNDTINGYGGNDVICGGKGNDKLNGGAGDDQIFGNDGDDTINGGVGTDKCSAGPGNDTATNCEKSSGLP
jgi:Ca2+-binding RTX toxin-like protein